MAAAIFRAVAEEGINVDMIVQNVSADGTTDISFTVPKADGNAAMRRIQALATELGFGEVVMDDDIGKVSLVGAGMKTHPGVASGMFEALAEAGVNIEMISTSTIRISVVVREADVPAAVQAVHERFGLGASDTTDAREVTS